MNTGKKLNTTEHDLEASEWPTLQEFFESTYPDSKLDLSDDEADKELDALLSKVPQKK